MLSSSLRDITLTASESNWRLFMLRKADPAFLAFQTKVWQRDNYTCQYCGFQAKQFMDVVNVDGNYRHNRLTNMATACAFCAQCFFLEAIGKSDFGGGNLIYLPEMSQGELNALCHVLFSSIVSGNNYSGQAKNIYRSFRLRVQQVEQHLGENMSVPSMYGQMLIDAGNRGDIHEQLMSKLRVLPDLVKFATQIETWAADGLNALVVNE